MRIDSLVKPAQINKIRDPRAGNTPKNKGFTDETAVHDEVSLTGGSNRLQELDKQLASLDIADPERIESLRQAIAEGRFNVDEEAVADALIKESLANMRRP